MKTCPSCQNPNPPQSLFCNRCGGAMTPASNTGQRVGPRVPDETPRHIAWGKKGAIGDAWFGLMFGVLFGGIPCTMNFIVVPIALTSEQYELLIGTAFTSVFALIGGFFFFKSVNKTRRNLHTLKNGLRAPGHISDVRLDSTLKVNNRPSTRVTWQFNDNAAKTHQGSIKLFDKARIAAHPMGAEVNVLHNGSGHSIVPSLVDVGFAVPPEPVDNRERVQSQRSMPRPETLARNASWTLATLPTEHRGGCLSPTITNPPGGTLAVSARHLALTRPDEHGAAEISWDKAFTTDLTVWLLSGDVLELNVSLIGQGGLSAPLSFRVRLSQACADRSLAIKQSSAPYLSAQDFKALWPAIVHYAHIHGNDLRDLVDLERHSEKSAVITLVTPERPKKAKKPFRPLKAIFGMGMFLFWFVAFPGLFLFIFGFSMKDTDEYRCAVKQLEQSKTVKKRIGKPLKMGTFAWLSSWETSGRSTEGHFSTSVSGPKGNGSVSVLVDRSPAASVFQVVLDVDGKDRTIYNGTYPCSN